LTTDDVASAAAGPSRARIDLDAWDPGYGRSVEISEGGGPSGTSTARVEADVELAAESWRALAPAPGVVVPDVVLLVDGVRRIEAQAWVTGADGIPQLALAASFAAGVVRCDLLHGVATVVETRIGRGLFTASSQASDLVAGSVRYPVRLVGGGQPGGPAANAARPSEEARSLEPGDLALAVQRELAALEQEVAAAARQRADTADDLMVLDGPLRGRAQLAHTLGYVKSHRVEYLPPSLTAVVSALGTAERCPVFRLGTNWHRYTWYLRLPGPAGAPWAGIVRVECSADLPPAQAISLADLSAVTLPRFASSPYKDPRAPQNLIPIAGLERRLRGLLGDARLLHRGLSAAASRTNH
jgi:hypothetical protein